MHLTFKTFIISLDSNFVYRLVSGLNLFSYHDLVQSYILVHV